MVDGRGSRLEPGNCISSKWMRSIVAVLLLATLFQAPSFAGSRRSGPAPAQNRDRERVVRSWGRGFVFESLEARLDGGTDVLRGHVQSRTGSRPVAVVYDGRMDHPSAGTISIGAAFERYEFDDSQIEPI